VTTTRVTAKKFKGQQLLAVGLGALGAIFIVAGWNYAIWGALLLLVALVWYFDDFGVA
jgi:drug/metabolite transporter (DMT)-like permease